ncbi:hypothetical protein RPMD05_64 [Rhodobacteraceae phage LS06-2018-MD05]|nr:hypothetical protein RPMD05_64 [Rhodobacteraceae phage LS06-2018-MD05]
MKKLIIILLFIPLLLNSGTINTNYINLSKDLELINNTINWVKSESIKQEMRYKKLAKIEEIYNCLSR